MSNNIHKGPVPNHGLPGIMVLAAVVQVLGKYMDSQGMYVYTYIHMFAHLCLYMDIWIYGGALGCVGM